MRRSLTFASSRRKIAIALSGGVDSSVAAYLLSQQYPNKQDILGIHMSNWDYGDDDDDENAGKCWEEDWKDARAVAQHLQIPIVHASFQSEYWTDVFEPYCQQLGQGGVTPNPDVDCNRYIKFGVLKEYLQRRYQIDVLATGHYARLWDPNNGLSTVPLDLQEAIEEDPYLYDNVFVSSNKLRPNPVLMAAKDASKDQSYFLTGVSGEAFTNVLFPLGDYIKKHNSKEEPQNGTQSAQPSVRGIALQAKLPTAHKRDSMGICFVGKRKHANFVNEFISMDDDLNSQNNTDNNKSIIQCINIEDGTTVATCHREEKNYPSLLFATVGQGAKISGASQKWFVVENDKSNRTLWLCPGTHHPSLYADTLIVQDMNWIAGVPPPVLPLRAQCRIRHLQPLVNCEIRRQREGGHYEIRLERPLRGIAPGQVCGIYYNNGLVCLGGGAISKRGATYWDLQKDLPASLHPSGHNDHSSSTVERIVSC